LTDDVVYEVAVRLLRGEAPRRIQTALKMQYQETVKRAIKAAVDRGFLVLRPHVDVQLQDELHRRRPHIRFHVVQDTFHPFEDDTPLGHDPVCRKAALVVGERIAALLRERPGDSPILVGNGGGLTLRNTIEFLAADVHDAPDVPGRLRFISLNGATWADIYDRSANYLAVRCSEIYAAQHIAVVQGWTPEMRRQYLDAVRGLDLLLLSAGSRKSSFLSEWLRRLNPPLELGEEFVGDVSYIPLKANGDELECSDEIRSAIQELQPALSYVSLMRYAGDGKVILVLSDHRNVRSPAVPKLEMAQAIIRANLASDVILGRSLATQLAATLEKA
jgi:hypothetical protein